MREGKVVARPGSQLSFIVDSLTYLSAMITAGTIVASAGVAAIMGAAVSGAILSAVLARWLDNTHANHLQKQVEHGGLLLWGERTLRSVANLTRQDAEAFLDLAPRIPIKTHVEPFPLDQANQALTRLREGHLRGAAILLPSQA